MKNELYQALCSEFGAEQTGIARREFTAAHGWEPSYIELLALLALRAGWTGVKNKEATT